MQPTNRPSKVTCQIPGKLFIAGEYAILQTGQAALLMAVDQYLTCTVEAHSLADKITVATDLPALHKTPLEIDIKGQNLVFPRDLQTEWHLVFHALQLAHQYLLEQQKPIMAMQVQITSNLQASDGEKYGLGSSGAVTVALILAILKYHGITLSSHLDLFKLAAIAQTRAGSNGSMADLATMTHGHWVYYQNFDHEWLKSQVNQLTICHLLDMSWPSLKIHSIQPPQAWQAVIGWTGKPASTQSLVSQLKQKLPGDQQTYQDFQVAVASLVKTIYTALEQKNGHAFAQAIDNNHLYLRDLGEHYQLPIETPLLRKLVALAQSQGFSAKLSGAGGGDCGIAFALDHAEEQIQNLKQCWQAAGIVALDFATAPRIIL